MCGIVGIGRFTTGGLYGNEVTVFRDLLIADMVRGMDGTGIIRVDRSGNALWRKVKGTPVDLFRTKGTAAWFSKSAPDCDRLLIGHNRFATSTNKDNDNAHPFQTGDITLVHNGNFTNIKELLPEATYPVDSEGLCAAISAMGAQKTFEKATGAFSVVFYDAKDKTLNFYRNYQRPMFITWDQTNKVVIFASEKKMVEWALDRNNLFDIKELPHELPVYQWRRFTIDGEQLEDVEIKPDYTKIVFPTVDGTDTAMAIATYGDGDLVDGVTGDWIEDTLATQTMRDELEQSRKLKKDKESHSTWGTAARRTSDTSNMERPEELFGYKRGGKITWTATEKRRTSDKQDQWRVSGCLLNWGNVDVVCHVKGESSAETLCDAHWVEGIVRAMERPKIGFSGTARIIVSDPIPHWGSDDMKKDAATTVAPTATSTAVVTRDTSVIEAIVNQVFPKKRNLH